MEKEEKRKIHTPHDITSRESEDEGAAPESNIYTSRLAIVFSFSVRERDLER